MSYFVDILRKNRSVRKFENEIFFNGLLVHFLRKELQTGERFCFIHYALSDSK